MTLKPSLSAYLDLLRFVAALSVVLGHMEQDGVGMARNPLTPFGHEAVVAFFVLSGFIIYYSTTARASGWRQYTVARLSRIYSVVLPAIVFCSALALWLAVQPWFKPAGLSDYTPVSWWHTVSTVLFLNQSWLNESNLSLNGPYWSLCYEVWFYVIFGLWYFAHGQARWWWVGASAVVAGPAILLLFPIWLMGAWLAASGRYAVRRPYGWAWAGFLCPLVVVVLIRVTDIDFMIKTVLHENVPGYWRLFYSQRFFTDYAIGAALCLHIASFSSLPLAVQDVFLRHQKRLAALAGFSFTLYLFHRPMTQISGAYFPVPQGEVLLSTLVALAILLACWAISWVTERRLSVWRRGFSRFLRPPQTEATR
jgi:peptidoglycan/LPS O-acetylase OafA/YrhL